MANGKLKGGQSGLKSKGPSSGKTSKRGAASSRGGSQSSVKIGKPAGISKSYRRTKGSDNPKNKMTNATFKSGSRGSVAFGTKRGATESRPKSKTTPEVQAGLASIPFRNRDIAKITKTNTGGSRTVSRPMKTNRTF